MGWRVLSLQGPKGLLCTSYCWYVQGFCVLGVLLVQTLFNNTNVMSEGGLDCERENSPAVFDEVLDAEVTSG